MSDIDYGDLYTSAGVHIPEPKVLPIGHWVLAADAVFFNEAKVSESGKQISPRFQMRYTPVQPLGDVSERDLEALGDYDFTMKGLNDVYSKTFWWNSVRERREFLDHLQKHTGFTLSEEPLLVVINKGTPEERSIFNPVYAQQIRGATINGVLAQETYKGETRNVANEFVPVQQAKAA
jgi:hypothetical protein